MPVTRSQKNTPLRPTSVPPPRHTTTSGAEIERSGGFCASASSKDIGATSKEGATPGTAKSAISGQTNMDAASQEKTAPQSTDNISMAYLPRATRAEASTRQSCRSHSIRTTTSSVKSRALLAKEKLARAEVRLARIELERMQYEEAECVAEDPDDDISRVEDWLHTSQHVVNENDIIPPNEGAPQENKVVKQENGPTKKITSEIEALTTAFKEAMFTRHSPPPPKFIYELPYFDGNIEEWLAFKVVYADTASMFSDIQNMARLRNAIKGNAREAIKSLLYSEASPDEVMRALCRRYGRPDALVLAELEKIRSLQRISEDPSDICTFANQVNNSVATIRGLKKPHYLRSPEMLKQIIDKLPSILKFRWYDRAASIDEGDCSDLETISIFLNNEADKCGAFATTESKGGYKRNSRRIVNSTRQVEKRESVKKDYKCPLCQGGHLLVACPEFKDKSIQDKWAAIKTMSVCFKCLRHKYKGVYCRSPPCKICRRGHHTMLHNKSTERVENEQASTQEATTEAQHVNTVQAQKAYLKMIRVEVYGNKGSKIIMALLDEGSTVSLLNADVSREIGLTGHPESLILETVGGKRINETESQKINLKVKGVYKNKINILKGVRTVQNLKLASQYLEKKRLESYSHLKNISEILYYEAEPPQLLIGQDNWEFIFSQKIIKGKPGQPVASMTKLGWVLHGLDTRFGKSACFSERCAHLNSVDDEMHMTIKEHFAIEALGVQPKRPSTDSEGKALALLEASCKRLSDGRYEAGLLWKNENETMPNNYTSAENRLKYIEKKLDRNSELKLKYNEQIQKLIDNKYAEKASVDSTSKRLWYLPHFSVEHPVKRKLRIVFDAAAKHQGKSLNDVLLPGPDLLQSLFGVLLRFRQGPYAVAADIREMFLQIRIKPEDRDSLRFLWRGDRRDIPPIEYRMTSVVFGATSSPSIAIYVKNKNAADYKLQYPEAYQAIERNHYMDDYLHSFHSEEDFRNVTKQVDTIHKKAGFELRGWTSNKPTLLDGFEIENTEKKEVNLVEKEEKTLGLRWFIEEDTIGFRANLRNTPTEIALGQKVPTKREVTSAVMSTFDPLGLASPILIQGKKLLQHTWRSGVDWDDKIETPEYEMWQKYLKQVKQLQGLQIPRCVSPCNTEGELHTFTDASETAYAAAVYWRTVNEDGTCHVNLIAAKVRVAPLKPVSIPRLELQAALLGCRLAKSVEQETDLKVKARTFWTDSSIVLSWIKTDPRKFKTFVAHRLAEIEDLTTPQEWRWVPTAENTADDATRDVPYNFDQQHRWFKGPDFLSRDKSCWPISKTFNKMVSGEEKTVQVTTAIMSSESSPDPHRFSCWKRLWRTTARMLQFIKGCKEKQRNSNSHKNEYGSKSKYKPLTTDLLEKAEILLLKNSQQECFAEEIRDVTQGKPVKCNSRLRKLDVVMENGILRLKGRIDAIDGVTRDYKRPIVLDSKNKIARLIIEYCHCRFNHANHATVINELRQRFWLLGLRSAIRAVSRECQWCRVNRAKPEELPTGNLPVERLRHGTFPFTCTGVDYFGPLSVTVVRRHEKRWVALFTCLTTRAVHVELVPSLSTDSMIMALRRFAARRGMPKIIYSDNGTNFVCASKELRDAYERMSKENMAVEAEKIGIQWKNIPPGAPHMGGAWERLVRSIKNALDVTLKERHPREEVLHTLLLEAEHIVNSRPLTHLSEDLEEEAITPNHFLIGRSCGSYRIGSYEDSELVGRDTWKKAQRLADHFWQRWLREYLPTLLPRKVNRQASKHNLQIGDIVLIVDNSLPRCTWPRGRITQVYPGPDGRTRIVDVETKGGVLRRPSSRIIVLVPTSSP